VHSAKLTFLQRVSATKSVAMVTLNSDIARHLSHRYIILLFTGGGIFGCSRKT
jgi:hypothetical protein